MGGSQSPNLAGMQQPNQGQFSALRGINSGGWNGSMSGGGQSGPLNSGGTDVTPFGPGSNTGSSGAQAGPLNSGGTDVTPYGPGANSASGGQSLIGGGIGTPYWNQQYQQSPQNVQNYYSPPAANQLGQFYPGQSIWPSMTPGQGGGGGNPRMPNGGKGNGGGNSISPTASPIGGQQPISPKGIGGSMSVV